MKGDILYWSLARILDWLVWGGELLDYDNLPREYPVVFISNHAAALGPIAIGCSLPIRLYPWVISDMMEWDKAAEYLRKDFVEPQLHIRPPASKIIAKWISRISVPLMHAIECIPVWHGERAFETYRLSIEALLAGKNLLIFPEDPRQPINARYHMTPFYKGFTRLGELYYKQTGRILRFHPLAVHPAERKVKVGKPISYNPLNDPVEERMRLKNILETTVQQLYLSIEIEGAAGIPIHR
ncbi:MAG TPA: hypothetical protein VNK49_03860 [Anaerolineales bacterium]|nr:hypothetical protein [Anaerolineales bacterium]